MFAYVTEYVATGCQYLKTMLADATVQAARIWCLLQTQEAANLSTALGIPIALVVGWIALQSYKSDKRIAASAHMHNLFQSYLSDVLANERSKREKGESKDKVLEEYIQEQMAGLKLYALEEMFVWIKDQRSPRLGFLNPRARRRRRQFQADAFNAWDATIRLHAKLEGSKVKSSIVDYTTCYSVEFLELVARALNDNDVDTLVKNQRSALNKGESRDLGNKERLPASTLDTSGPPAPTTVAQVGSPPA